MDRSRRGGGARPATAAKAKTEPPAASRLTVRAAAAAKARNRRRPSSVWSRLPRPRAIADACGRAARRSVPALAATAALATIGTSVWLGYRFVTTSERFAITAVEITGEVHLTEAQIVAALPVSLGDNIFATNLDDAASTLRATPWIANATVRRILPDKLVVEVVEHTAAAVVELGELYLVDTSGHPFKRARLADGDGARLPVITGIARATYDADPDGTAHTITSALAALAAWTSGPDRPAIGELHIDTHRSLTLRTYDTATAIQLGPLASPPQLALRIGAFDAVWADLTDTERARARAIHLGARTDQVTIALATPDNKD